MAEDKKDSFWDSKNDDFWSKPVVSDDWLKTGDDSFWNTDSGAEKEPENNPVSTGSQSLKTEDKKESTWQSHREVKNVQNNPYMQHYTSEQVQDILEGKKPRKIVYDRMNVPEEPKTAFKKKQTVSEKKHVHTKICLVAIGITVFSVLAFVLATKWKVHIAKEHISKFTGAEKAAGDEILLTGNDVMYLEDAAYTIVPEFRDELWAEDVKLIVVYAQIFSDYFEDYDKDDLEPYIGYDTEYGREYRTMYNSWDIDEALLGEYGFSSEHMLYSRIGKGYDTAGYYFFAVPLAVTEIDFCIETYSFQNNSRTVEKTYVRHMQIEEQPDLSELLSRKVVR